jgi:hypothetical protein
MNEERVVVSKMRVAVMRRNRWSRFSLAMFTIPSRNRHEAEHARDCRVKAEGRALSLRAEPRLAQDEVGVLAGSEPRTVAAVRGALMCGYALVRSWRLRAARLEATHMPTLKGATMELDRKRIAPERDVDRKRARIRRLLRRH